MEVYKTVYEKVIYVMFGGMLYSLPDQFHKQLPKLRDFFF